jgi:hypothetical protein
MKVGLCRNHMLEPHIAAGIRAAGDELVDYADSGCDIYIAWGWPMAQEVERSIRVHRAKNMPPIVCVDRGMIDPTRRIFAINGWGALAHYHAPRALPFEDVVCLADPEGPVLIIGQVPRAQKRCGEVDQWDSPGYERWVAAELAKPNRKFREHPRVYNLQGHKVRQATLAEDLDGCAGAIGWNSTALIHAAMLGYPVETVEAHGMLLRFSPRGIFGLEWTLTECAEGTAWNVIRAVRAGELPKEPMPPVYRPPCAPSPAIAEARAPAAAGPESAAPKARRRGNARPPASRARPSARRSKSPPTLRE